MTISTILYNTTILWFVTITFWCSNYLILILSNIRCGSCWVRGTNTIIESVRKVFRNKYSVWCNNWQLLYRQICGIQKWCCSWKTVPERNVFQWKNRCRQISVSTFKTHKLHHPNSNANISSKLLDTFFCLVRFLSNFFLKRIY